MEQKHRYTVRKISQINFDFTKKVKTNEKNKTKTNTNKKSKYISDKTLVCKKQNKTTTTTTTRHTSIDRDK